MVHEGEAGGEVLMEPYLILHKVRGLPAFDIAILCEDMGTEEDPGPWWIIPTSGHRAYPSDYVRLDWLQTNMGEYAVEHMASPTEDLPDHCHYDLDRTPGPIASLDVASALAALIKPQTPMVRRKL